MAFYQNNGCSQFLIPNTVTKICEGAFSGSSHQFFKKVFIPASVTSMPAFSYIDAQFYGSNPNVVVYCEASSKPDGWGEYWNYYSSTGKVTVIWGATQAQFEAG